MSDIAIKIENLSKQYRLGVVGTQTLRGDLQRLWWKIRGKGDPTIKIGEENKLSDKGGDYIWALRDINLDVKEGEVLGIIGKNGAGKSTLLKILSRVTGPTTGNVKIKGRLASLLEVGTGFHPELTGRENIYLNGAILGMTKAEIDKQFDAIVDFAGIAKYIDTPVKRYSSGMYVRLGFAVAAHLNSEILVVDEVLAVGDAEFQKKAIGKMQDVSKGQGRTVLFVSHNMDSILKLTHRVVLLDKGKIIDKGKPQRIVEKYLNLTMQKKSYKSLIVIERREPHWGNFIKIINGSILNSQNKTTDKLLFGEPYKFKIKLKAYKDLSDIEVSIRVDSIKNVPVCSIVSGDSNAIWNFYKDEIKEIIVDMQDLLLTPGSYNLVITIRSGRMAYDRLENILDFSVLNLTYKNIKPHNGTWGFIQIYPEWKIIK